MMINTQVAEAKTLTVPVGATTLTIIHEWGKETSVSVSGTYSWTPNSIGVHKLVWKNGASIVRTDFHNCFVPLLDKDSFIADHAAYSSLTDAEFDKVEAAARHNIQVYTGQRFGPYVGQILEIQGDGGDSLYLPVPALALTSVETTYGTDLTDLVEVSPNEPAILQRVSRFNDSRYYEIKRDVSFSSRNFFDSDLIFVITGNFGWEYVPAEVSMAADLLILDELAGSDVSELRAQGVYEAQIGDFSLKLNADQWGTTGNVKADNLLSGFVNIGLGLV